MSRKFTGIRLEGPNLILFAVLQKSLEGCLDCKARLDTATLRDLIWMGDRLALIVRVVQLLPTAGRPGTETVITVGTREGSLHPS